MPTSSHVWYAAYGPSMVRERMLSYLYGSAGAGLAGARSKAAPLAEAPFRLPYDLCLSGHTTSWVDAPALLSPSPRPAGVLARGYLLETSQLFDVLSQQTGSQLDLVEGEGDLLLDVVRRDGQAEFGPGMFEALVDCGTFAGHQVVAFTSTWALSGLAPFPPEPAALADLSAALRSCWALSDAELSGYLGLHPSALVA